MKPSKMKLFGYLFILLCLYQSCTTSGEKTQFNESRNSVGVGDTSVTEYTALAKASIKDEKYQEAIKYYTTLINIDSLKGDYYFGRGYAYSMIFQMNLGKEDLLKSIKYNYRASESYYMIGMQEILNRKEDLAEMYFIKSLEIDPSFTQASEALSAVRKGKRVYED